MMLNFYGLIFCEPKILRFAFISKQRKKKDEKQTEIKQKVNTSALKVTSTLLANDCQTKNYYCKRLVLSRIADIQHEYRHF